MNSLNVLLIERQPILREALERIISSSNYVSNVKSYDSIPAYGLYHSSEIITYDVVIVDPNVESAKTYEFIRQLLTINPDCYVILNMLESNKITRDLFATLDIKCMISKLDSYHVLEGALIAAFSKNEYRSTSLGNEHSFNIDFDLSSREKAVLKMLTEGLRNKEVARILDISEKTVSTYKSRLLKKIGATSIVNITAEYM